MPESESCVTVHMVASVDGFIARQDRSVDWLETTDHYPAGTVLDDDAIENCLRAIDCYVMGARTYETAVRYVEQGFGWPYGEKPTIVLSHRQLPAIRSSVDIRQGDLAALFNSELRRTYRSIWIVGGGMLVGECLRLGLVDEIRYALHPVALGQGRSFFGALDQTTPLHLLGVEAFQSGMVELRYAVRREHR